MNCDVAMDGSAFLQHHRRGVNVALHGGRRLHLDSAAHHEIPTQVSADHHFASFDVADHGAAGANDQSIDTMKRSLDSTIDANRTLGLYVAGNGQLIID